MTTKLEMPPELPLWTPAPGLLNQRRLSAYSDWLEQQFGLAFGRDYAALHRWSIGHAAEFWRSIIKYHHLTWSGSLSPAVDDLENLPSASWLPGLQLNYLIS